MESLKMFVLTLIFLHSFVVKLTHCIPTSSSSSSSSSSSLLYPPTWISIPYTAPFGHFITKLPCCHHHYYHHHNNHHHHATTTSTTVSGVLTSENSNSYTSNINTSPNYYHTLLLQHNKKCLESLHVSDKLFKHPQKFQLKATLSDIYNKNNVSDRLEHSLHISSSELHTLFSLDYTNCVLQTNANLNSWKERNITLNLNTSLKHYHLIVHISSSVTNINLKFSHSKYFGSITENQPYGTYIQGLKNLNVSAYLAINSEKISLNILPKDITYHIIRPQYARKIFGLNVSSEGKVQIFSKMSLDHEKRPNYHFILEAIGPQGSFATTTLRVDVSNLDDSAPVMKKRKYLALINTDTPVGTPVLRVSASDPDDGHFPNSRITYNMESQEKNSDHFAINPNTGFIYVNRSLPQSLEFSLLKVHATDESGRHSRSSFVKIGIYDQSSNAIRHMSNPTRLRVTPAPEVVVIPSPNDTVSSSSLSSYSMEFPVRRRRSSVLFRFVVHESDSGNLFNISATDTDPSTQYFLINDPSKWFTVDSNTGIIRILPGKTINSDTFPTVDLTFNVSTTTGWTTRQVKVDLVKDKPYFINSPKPLRAVVTKAMAAGDSVYTLRSQSKRPGHRITYEMTDPNNYFTLDKTTGDIKILWKDKLIWNQYYTLQVFAVDNSVSPALRAGPETVEVYYGNLAPQFYQTSYTGKVFERNQPNQEIQNLKIAVKSFSGNNIKFSLETLADNETTEFDIRKKLGKNAEATVYVMKTFYYNKDPDVFNLKILASDSKLTSSVPLTIHLVDVNDHSPSFSTSNYIFLAIKETIPVGSSIEKRGIAIIATDRDSGKNAELDFAVTDSHFKVNKTRIASGQYQLTLVVDKPLDYEMQPVHKFNITASDRGDPALNTSAQVEVHLENVNNKAPVFQGPLAFEVNEKAPLNSYVTKLKVFDPDGDNVCYYFGDFKSKTENFAIDKKLGTVTVIADLSNSKEKYVLNITVTDEKCCCEKSIPHKSHGVMTISVEDVNNNKPTFPNCNSYNTSINENAPINSLVISVTAEDRDRGKNGEISYTLIEGDARDSFFKVDSKSGNISVVKSLVDLHNTYNVLIRATDNGTPRLYGLCLLTINVIDVNNNQPKFDQKSYEHTENKNTVTPGKPIFTIQATDADEGENAEISYSLSNDTYFSIDQRGSIIVNRTLLDFSGSSISLVVTATDHGKPPLNSSADITINLVNSTTNIPQWLNSSDIPIIVSENQERNVPFAVLIADSNINNPRVRYCLPNCLSFYGKFKIKTDDNNRMLLMLKDNLDYETQREHTIWVKAINFDTPKNMQKERKFIIKVKDENDNSPVFEKFNSMSGLYETTILENQNASTSVAKVFVTDADISPEFRNISFSLKDDTYFSIDNNGIIRSKQMFDREKTEYYFVDVIAVDSDIPGQKNTESRPVKIKILDVNDEKPYFEKPLYSFTIPEDVRNGYSVLTLTAKDKDDPMTTKLDYSITSDIFYVENGIIKVRNNKLLDYETQPHTFNLTYIVSDGLHEANTTIQAFITDVNDNSPRFLNQSYEVHGILEQNVSVPMTKKEYLLTVNATDADKDRANNITYHLAGGNWEKTAFEIDSKTGEIYLIKPLDYDFGTGGNNVYSFSVFAVDEPGTGNERKGFTIVNVFLEDINDNTPTFVGSLVGSVPENSPINEDVMKATAKDFDSGENGNLTFSLEVTPRDSQLRPYFVIDQNTGTIRVGSPELDREKKPQYRIKVNVSDQGSPPRSQVKEFVINIEDVNDNAPEFKCVDTNREIAENFPLGAPYHRIYATDEDKGMNADLQYSIVTEPAKTYFKIEADNKNKFGAISLYKPLDYEDPTLRSFTMNISVRDNDQSHVDYCSLQITVTDFNDNPPVFVPDNKEIFIPENITKVDIFTFGVSDKDSGKNKIVNFSIDRKSNPLNQFGVRKTSATSAEISVKKSLDREETAKYRLIVIGVDEGYPPQTGSATLTVNVTDVNDNYPIFAEDYRPIIYENTPPQKDFQLIRAKDLDGYGNQGPFIFSHQCNPAPCKDFSMVFDSKEQVGRVSSLREFDRERKKHYDMPIVMSDSGNPVMTGTNFLRIQIGDINDNKHGPGATRIVVYNYKGLFGNLPIGRVYCQDLDDWDNGDKTYTFLSNITLAGYFKLLSNGTIIMAKGVPEREYFFQASVYDKVFKNTETCNVTVKIIGLSEEAVRRSGSVRFKGVTPREFIKFDPARNSSAYSRFKLELSTILQVPLENVELFSVMENKKGFTDVRYSAHNSPWYTPGMTNGAVAARKLQIMRSIGYDIDHVDINECQTERCDAGGCTNRLVIKNTPVLINSNETGLVGVNTNVVAECICGARDFSKPVDCTPDYCYNGGYCEKDVFQVVKCVCPKGYTGPRCQQTGVSFKTKGYALFSPLEQCDDSRTSLEFSTQQDGLLFYNGPVTNKSASLERDYILLEIIKGYPQLSIDHGTGELILSLAGKNNGQTVTDGKWHRIDVIRNKREVRLILDLCEKAVTPNDRSSCEVKNTTPGENIYLNTVDPLQIGGLFMDATSMDYPHITIDSFRGCIKNFIHNRQIYNLGVSSANSFSQNAESGCWYTKSACQDKCGGNSTCVADFQNNYKCVCNPGFRGDKCNKETTQKFFKASSLVNWKFKNGFYNKLNDMKNEMQARFRTRQPSGLLFKVPGNPSNEYLQLEIIDRKACLGYNFGQTSSAHPLCLDHVNVTDGQWHTLKMQRVGSELQLMMDGGEGRFYADRFVKNLQSVKFKAKRSEIVAGADVTFQSQYTTVQGKSTLSYTLTVKGKDFKLSCMDDIRYDDAWLPMQESEKDSRAATVERFRYLGDCILNDCQGINCGPFQSCVPLFGMHKCMCQAGYTPGYKNSRPQCVPIDQCADSKCFGNATCVSKVGSFRCVCPEFWAGTLCNQPTTSPIIGNNTLATGALVTILVCIFIILIIVLLVLLFKRNKKPASKFVLEVDSDDDIRENVISYDEEGAGEEDQLAYDISRLRKAEPTLLKPSVDKPVRSYNPNSGDRPEVGNYINDLIREADDDDVAPPFDSVREFVYEGEDSDAGSLSSLNTSSGSEGENYDALNEWGPKFAKLADMYGGGGGAE